MSDMTSYKKEQFDALLQSMQTLKSNIDVFKDNADSNFFAKWRGDELLSEESDQKPALLQTFNEVDGMLDLCSTKMATAYKNLAEVQEAINNFGGVTTENAEAAAATTAKTHADQESV